LGELPGLRGSTHAELQAELARIVEEGGTPAQLSAVEVPDAENVAAGIEGLFPPEQLDAVLEASEELFPESDFEFDAAGLLEAVEFRREHEAVLEGARKALRRPKCEFGVDFRRGFEADLSFVDVARICARLEALEAAELLSRGKPADAIDPLAAMLDWAACLAGGKHPVSRMEAAFLRTEAATVLGAIAAHPEVGRAELERLYQLAREQLDAWPPDARAWIGDRALGMWAYELVRAGRLQELLTEEEILQFAEEGILSGLPDRAKEGADEDELFYLQAMRKVIQSCGKPYHQRTEVLESIRGELHERRNSPEFPVVAGRLLLADLETGLLNQAQDRANWEGWAVALAAASGADPPPYHTNPISGKPYEVIRKDGLVMVWNVGDSGQAVERPVVVPQADADNSQ
jgi:hypothetical protein